MCRTHMEGQKFSAVITLMLTSLGVNGAGTGTVLGVRYRRHGAGGAVPEARCWGCGTGGTVLGVRYRRHGAGGAVLGGVVLGARGMVPGTLNSIDRRW